VDHSLASFRRARRQQPGQQQQQQAPRQAQQKPKPHAPAVPPARVNVRINTRPQPQEAAAGSSAAQRPEQGQEPRPVPRWLPAPPGLAPAPPCDLILRWLANGLRRHLLVVDFGDDEGDDSTRALLRWFPCEAGMLLPATDPRPRGRRPFGGELRGQAWGSNERKGRREDEEAWRSREWMLEEQAHCGTLRDWRRAGLDCCQVGGKGYRCMLVGLAAVASPGLAAA
jgi:hypothetical protein